MLRHDRLSRIMSSFAMETGKKRWKSRPFGWWLANKLVFKEIQRKLGLDRCIEVHAVGNLMLPRTAEFFTGLNMLILTAWGNTETTGPHVVSSPDRHRLGSCGVEMDGCSMKFVPVEKNNYTEILVKGRNVFMGYLNEPQMTQDAFDEDGWHKTGDLGYRDESGFIWIVGSLYELYHMSDGRIFAPIVVEEDIKNLLPFMGHCFAYARNRPYIVMLFTLDAAIDEVTEFPLDVLSNRAEMFLRNLNVEVSAISKMVENPPENLVAIIQSAIDAINATSQDPATTIRKWKFLPRDFSVPTGEMTLSFRERRNYIIDMYASTLDSMYASDE